jgi:asparagine synthase (glutamine-hydrolysing)
MCGIAGLMMRDGRLPPPEALEDILARLSGALAHRGPDGHGRHLHGGVALVHTRLAIVDVAHGRQPFVAADGVVLAANGEIYNDLDLRAELHAADFTTASDCESALHLYRRHGEGFADHLRGMYALAIHDPARGRLILARDPFGIKPLYYAETPQGFYFASEPQALISAGVVAAQVDAQARDEALAFNFSTGTATPFAGITRVAPGETLVVENARIAARLQQPALPTTEGPALDDAAALRAWENVWRDTVFAHQRAEVPYGMFLSGGIDSAAVLAMMARLNERPVLAFTASFPGTDAHDERAGARAAAAAAGARHVEIAVTAQDFWRTLPAIAEAMDDPAMDYAVVPTYLLAQHAAREVKVVLSGEGGDELFAGYGRTRAALRPWPFNKRPWRRHALANFGGLRAVSPGWRDGMTRIEMHSAGRQPTRLRALQAADCAAWLPNDLLLKVDRCLMAHGVEGRVPFLDPAVAAFAFPLADRQKIRAGRGKWLLRRWLADTFPAAAAFAPKRGFTVPVAEWIAAEGGRLGPLVARQAGIAEICMPGSVEALFSGIDRRNGSAAWALLFYALWHQRHIIGRRASGDVFQALG